MGKKRDGEEVKQVVSCRIEPSTYFKIIKQFGSFSSFIKAAIKKLLK